MNPVIYAGPTGEIELYWFYPGLHNENFGNIMDRADDGFFVSEQDRQFAVLTRFSINPPIIISQMSTYISTMDVFPEYPGDQFSPIGLSLKKRNLNGEFIDYCNQLISLDSGVTGDGARIDCRVDLFLKNDFEIWTGLEWLPNFPTAPLVGVNYFPPALEQYICPMIDSAFPLQECNDEYMIGLETFGWTGSNDRINYGELNDAMFFKVLYAADTNNFFSLCTLIDSLGVDSLCSKSEIYSNGYLCVVSSDGANNIHSDFIYIDINKLPSVFIRPARISGSAENSVSGSFSFNLQNTGWESLPVLFNYDKNLLKILSDSVVVAGGENIDIEIMPIFEDSEDSLINASIIIRTLDDYYPIIYRLNFTRSEATYVRESSEILPVAFNVGQPQPNPFNGSVIFNLESGATQEISFDVYNILGQNIYSDVFRAEKNKTIRWEGVSIKAKPISSGIYFFRFATDDYRVYRKALLLK
jgi:hypothetical protein